MVYLFVQFPIGIGAFVFLVSFTTVGTAFVTSPLIVGPTSVIDSGAGARWVIDEPAEAWWLPIVGTATLLIAEAFVASEGTVKTHVKRVLAKLVLRDRTQVAVWAYEHGAVEPVTRATPVEGHRSPAAPS